MADVSLPVILARRSPGTAIAAMMLMIATTISSSIRVKPCSLLPFMFYCSPINQELCESLPVSLTVGSRGTPSIRVPYRDRCRTHHCSNAGANGSSGCAMPVSLCI